MKKFLSIALVVFVLISALSFTAFAETKSFSASLRIEGAEKTYFNHIVTINSNTDTTYTVGSFISLVEKNNPDLTVKGADTGYITEVNGEKSGQFGGWDGWYYTVNGETPEVGVSDYKLSANDVIVIYYGDYPCKLPETDTTWFAAKGVMRFTSLDTEYDADWNPTTVRNPIAGMTVTLDGVLTYVTDENGEIQVDLKHIAFGEPEINVQVSMIGENGAPQVCRFAPDYTVTIEERTCAKYGDATGDGQVDIRDVTQIQLYAASAAVFTPEQFIAADVNEDYDVNILDATVIQLYLAGAYTELPVKS